MAPTRDFQALEQNLFASNLLFTQGAGGNPGSRPSAKVCSNSNDYNLIGKPAKLVLAAVTGKEFADDAA
jgi:hypothetical protein